MRQADKIIITSATTGAMHMPCMSPYLPLTPEQIVEDSVKAADAGAAIIHLHARRPEDGMPTTDVNVYEAFLKPLKERTNAIINITTGQPHFGTPEEVIEARLAAPLKFAPEMCSFNMGPMNPAPWVLQQRLEGKIKFDWERSFMAASKQMTMINTYALMERIAKELGEERGIVFEYECFDIGHLYALALIADRGWVKPPFFVQSIFGFLGGLGTEADHLVHMRQTADRLFGDDYAWSVLAAGREQIRMTTLGAAMGSHVRVGMEDSLWAGKGELARSSADQVVRIRTILEQLSLEPASPDEARAILGTKGAHNVGF
ncbi:beta-keto acid cleavage family enzyme [Sphingosinicella rhizophila]|uniref:3-keto-5-aminohexanoate cleavage protein n=1 Tax=Sphingosinicella rhizophila TaxID=3050082 RepID=A0ABU3Q756_9SPHN|nr:3-keto-5-aminohexanoate cleavage protein [Sphingosinicella sp. GR2756]MDT9598813.1 3-keto-5-aminohexanoate cleavage protein [Sphingosinicella sp. GR2756]